MNIKRFLTIAAVATLCWGASAQDKIVIDDFEGSSKDWAIIEDVVAEVVDNPAPDNVNKSEKVLKCVRPTETNNWAGVILRDVYSLAIGPDEETYSYATVKFLKKSIGDVSFKIESGPDDETYESNMPYLQNDGWTTVTFDLREAKAGTYKDFFVMLDRADDISEDIEVYIDDITLIKSMKQTAQPIDPNSQRGTGETNGYKLIWQDLFDDGRLDRVWNVEERNDGGGNNELQYYTRNNVIEAQDEKGNGCLIITAKKQPYGNKQCTSGRLTTQGGMSFCHGKVEASIRLPKTANGLWPAFWMLGADIDYNNWPYCGEIDIMEMGNSEGFEKGAQERYFNGACHWGPMQNGNHSMYTQSNTWDYSLQDGEYHLYTLYWDDQKIVMYLDQDKYPSARPYYQMNIGDKSQESSPGRYFHKKFFLLFNLAIGGDFPHIYDINQVSALQNGEAKMYVNYVRVYQKGVPGEEFQGPVVDYTGLEDLSAKQNININEWAGHIYTAQGMLVNYFEAGEASVIDQLSDGIYFIVLENNETIKMMKRGR